MKKIIITVLALSVFTITSCNEELEINPQGTLVKEVIVQDEVWVNQQLISAYGVLDGLVVGWKSPVSNWTLGDVASDDFYKGSSGGDQPDLNEIERYGTSTVNSYTSQKWTAIYDGINKCNRTLQSATAALANGTPAAKINPLMAEARFLRAHYHMDAKKIWNNIPYISEATREVPSNEIDIWSNIEEDLEYAVANLPTVQNDKGRPTSWSAKSYLAKAHMFQQDFTAAKLVLNDIISNGPYALVANYHDNFNAGKNNNSESVFAVQHSVNDGGDGFVNGNYGNLLAHYSGAGSPSVCCGFFQPSQNLVNAFKTDANGLPLLDTFNTIDVINDEGIPSTQSFTPYTGNLDPRLDWTVGRRGIDYLGWGDMPGVSWIRDQVNAGPYIGKKHEVLKSQSGTLSHESGMYNAINTPLVRYSDVLLWRAEIYAEEGELTLAMDLVNKIRNRAANPAGFVKKTNGTPAANYVINAYTSFPSKEYAIKAVRFERRLELASEGHRFFDLVRWGTASNILNSYVTKESAKRTYLGGASFAERNNYYPIPLEEIESSGGVLKQNSGY